MTQSPASLYYKNVPKNRVIVPPVAMKLNFLSTRQTIDSSTKNTRSRTEALPIHFQTL